jgi:ABC-2 type transport system permease protein
VPTYLATYREKGILRRLSTTPVHPAGLLGAQVAMALLIALFAVTLVLGVGIVAFVLAAASLLSVGVLVAAVAPSGRAASGIGTMLFFPMMFFAGLYVPRDAMPAVLRRIGDFTPLGAGVQALQDAAGGAWPQPLHLAVMAAFAVVAGLAAARLFRWE